jgi:hypothetical protein
MKGRKAKKITPGVNIDVLWKDEDISFQSGKGGREWI